MATSKSNSKFVRVNGKIVRRTKAQQVKPTGVTTPQTPQVTQQKTQINTLTQEINLAKGRINIIVNERTNKFGIAPTLSTRRKQGYKQFTAKLRAERKIVDELNKILSDVKKGNLVNLKDLSRFKQDIRNVELRKTKRAVKRIESKSIIGVRDVTPTQVPTINRKEVRIQINRATSGKKPDTKKLFSLGFTGSEVTQIVAAFETGANLESIKNQNVNALFKRLEEGKGKVIVDTTSQAQAFKVGVNQEFRSASRTNPNYKPLPFTASVQEFNKQYKKLLDERKKVLDKLTTGVEKQITKQLNINVNSIRNKALTGQSMTPQEISKYNLLQIAAGKELNKAQLNNLKQATLIVPAYVYGKNLVIRSRGGEKTPLWNDLKEITREFKAASYDTGKEIGGFLGTATRKSIEVSFKYGVRITREAQKGNFVLDDDIKLLTKKVYSGVTTTKQAIDRTKKFVKENPILAAIIVSNAVAGTGEALWKKFKKDPVEVTINALLLKGVKIPKVAAGTPIGRIVLEEKFIRSNPKELRPFVRAIVKGAKAQEKLTPVKVKSLKKINFNVVQELNKFEAMAVSKALRETDSFIFGSLPARVISKGKTKIPKDVDLATANKKKFVEAFINNLPKNQRKNYKIKGEKLLGPRGRELFDIKGYDRLRPEQSVFGTGALPIYENVAKSGRAIRLKQAALTVPTQPLVEIGGIKAIGFGEQTTRKALGTLQVLIEKNPKRAKDPAAFVESLKIQLAALKGQIPKGKIGKVLSYPKTLKANQLEKSIKLLESKSFETALNKAVPGTTKDFPIVDKIKKLIKVNTTKVNANVKTKLSKLKAKPSKKPSKKKVKPSKKVSEGKPTPKSKKVSKKKPSKIPKSKIPKSRIPKSRVPKSKVPKSKIPSTKKPVSKVPAGKKKPSKVPTPKTKPSKIPSTKKPVSRVPTGKPRPSRIPPSKIPTTRGPPTKAPPVTNILLRNYDKLKRKGKRQGFIIQIKEGNKIVAATTKLLPRNRAINLGRKRVDGNARASYQIVNRGFTDIIDVQNTVLNQKFRPKKSKNPKVRKEVEKRKYRRDKPLEKKEIKGKKVPKPKKKTTKKVSKGKLTPKSKKVSKKPSKKKK